MPCIPLFLLLLSNMSGIPVTRWVGSEKPTSFAEWSSAFPAENHLSPANVFQQFSPGADLIEIIVESSLYQSLTAEISVLASDLQSEGYSVSVDTVRGVQTLGACVSLRDFLISKFPQDLVGAYFIGNVPVAWFQMIDDWGSGPESYEEFPCDLFYMELDGTWADESLWVNPNLFLSPGPDGILDFHTGNTSPEIWVGRLYLSSLGDEDSLAKVYLRRSHLYRTDSFQSVSRGLSYVDDDWAYWAGEFSSNMQSAYLNVTSVSQIDTTNPVNYKKYLSSTYEWVGIFCHSSYMHHSFKVQGGASWADMYGSELPGLKPLGLFYNLFACSNTRFIENNFMGGMYVIKTPFGLEAVGSTKTGSMLEFGYFYTPLGQGQNMGEAYLAWYQHIASNGFTNTEKAWHYGMTLFGDPTLSLKTPGPFLYVTDFSVLDASGNNNGRIDPSETADITFSVFNLPDAQNAYSVNATLASLDSSLFVSTANSSCPSIPAGDTLDPAFTFTVDAAASFTPHQAQIALYMNDSSSGRVICDTFDLFIGRHPVLVVDDDGGNSTEGACLQSLENLGVCYEYICRDSFPVADNLLSSYEMIIWLTGGVSSGTLTAQDQTDIVDYFNGSGKILIYGQSIAEELSGTSFLSDFLGVSWQGNTANHFQTGMASDPIGENLLLATSNQTSQDMLAVISGVSECFRYQTNPEQTSMIRKENPGKCVFAGFGFEGIVSTIPGYAPVDTLFSRILNYMELNVGVEEEIPEVPTITGFSVFQTFAGIFFRISGANTGQISIKIYDVLGRRVNTVYEGPARSGNEFFWDFSDETGREISSGTYFAILTLGSKETAVKFTALR
ncbi:hypothetical protein JXL83_00230 [candidate division WOR-3 bacterium]|nr:hypothetical protein [candidate division WOR-3 bacterium]